MNVSLAPVYMQPTYVPAVFTKIFPSASLTISINGLPNLETALTKQKNSSQTTGSGKAGRKGLVSSPLPTL